MLNLYNYHSVKEGVQMAVSKAQQAAVHKYVKNNYDRLELTLPKGQKEEIKVFAASRGESVNAFISKLIADEMAKEKHTGG